MLRRGCRSRRRPRGGFFRASAVAGDRRPDRATAHCVHLVSLVARCCHRPAAVAGYCRRTAAAATCRRGARATAVADYPAASAISCDAVASCFCCGRSAVAAGCRRRAWAPAHSGGRAAIAAGRGRHSATGYHRRAFVAACCCRHVPVTSVRACFDPVAAGCRRRGSIAAVGGRRDWVLAGRGTCDGIPLAAAFALPALREALPPRPGCCCPPFATPLFVAGRGRRAGAVAGRVCRTVGIGGDAVRRWPPRLQRWRTYRFRERCSLGPSWRRTARGTAEGVLSSSG